MMENGYLTQTTEKRLMIVSGEGYPELAERIAERLDHGPECGRADRVSRRRALRQVPAERAWGRHVHRPVPGRAGQPEPDAALRS